MRVKNNFKTIPKPNKLKERCDICKEWFDSKNALNIHMGQFGRDKQIYLTLRHKRQK